MIYKNNFNKQIKRIRSKPFFLISGFSFLLIILSNIFFSNYRYSYGADEFIVLTIPAFAISSSETVLDYLISITHGLFLEDHLNITTNILSPLILTFSDNNLLKAPAGFLYLISLFLSYRLAVNLTKNREIAIYAVFLIASNITVTWYLSTSNITFVLSLIFQIIVINFAIKLNENRKIYNHVILFFCVVLGSFSFENFFLCFFIVGPLLFSNDIRNIRQGLCNLFTSFLRKLPILLTLITGLFPYFYIHKLKFGTILPGSRIGNDQDHLDNLDSLYVALKTAAKILNELLLGVPEILLFVGQTQIILIGILLFSLILLFLFVISRNIYLFKTKKNGLVLSIIISIIIASATGRHHPGMWSIIWVIQSLYFSIIIVKISNKFRQYRSYFLVSVPFLFLAISKICLDNSPRTNELISYNQRSYLLDKTLSSLSKNLSSTSLFIDLSDDNIFHEIRYLISERTQLGIAPAIITGFKNGSQPLGSSIKFSLNSISQSNMKNYPQLFEKLNIDNFIIVLDEHVLIITQDIKDENWRLYRWDGCNNMAFFMEDSIINKNRKNKLLSVAGLFDIENEKMEEAYENSKCKNFTNQISYDVPPVKNKSNTVTISSPVYHCRFEIKNQVLKLNSLNYIEKNNHLVLEVPRSFPMEIKSTSIQSNKDERIKRNYFVRDESEFETILKNICQI
tara:strand:+ start:1576 stop:3621 length:2046 start_codon:yes stop_codon:yes gene_type:complete